MFVKKKSHCVEKEAQWDFFGHKPPFHRGQVSFSSARRVCSIQGQ